MTAGGQYLTLGKPGIFELLEKKSRFISLAQPVAGEDEALDFIKRVREEHKTASHHCFAYIIGANAGLMRYQDDGEPQGTAGIPILEVLKKNQLVYCAAVVVRYFGGVLLGAGGLTRAYSAVAAGAVRASGIVCAQSSVKLHVKVAYPFWDALNYHLGRLPVCDIEREFTDQVSLGLTVREQDASKVIDELTTLIDGSAAIAQSEAFYHLWEVPDSGAFSPQDTV